MCVHVSTYDHHQVAPTKLPVTTAVIIETWKIDFKRHVPQKYMMWFEDVKGTVERHVQSDVPQEDAILLKEPGIYCFFLRCKIPRAKPFMEWVVETVLP